MIAPHTNPKRQQGTLSKSVRLAAGSWLLVGLGIASVSTGCSKPKFYPTRGKVVVFAVGPLSDGEIRFRPTARPSLIASGKIQKDGSFSLSTPGHGEGAVEGDCQVAIVVEPKDGKRPIADRYGDYSTSDLSYTIYPRDENYFILDVKKR
jgi:hypothetical protein